MVTPVFAKVGAGIFVMTRSREVSRTAVSPEPLSGTGGGASGSTTVMVKVDVRVNMVGFVAVRVTEVTPACVGVPSISPVDEFTVNPGGSAVLVYVGLDQKPEATGAAIVLRVLMVSSAAEVVKVGFKLMTDT
jgi:hypothetical protein